MLALTRPLPELGVTADQLAELPYARRDRPRFAAVLVADDGVTPTMYLFDTLDDATDWALTDTAPKECWCPETGARIGRQLEPSGLWPVVPSRPQFVVPLCPIHGTVDADTRKGRRLLQRLARGLR